MKTGRDNVLIDTAGWLLACAMAVGVRVWIRGVRSVLSDRPHSPETRSPLS